MVHIVFFSPYAQLQEQVEDVFSKRQDATHIRYEVLLDHYDNHIHPSSDWDVVIARGFTAENLRFQSIIPSVELKTTGYDVIAAVDRCLKAKPYRRIAAVGAENMMRGVEQIACVYPDVEFRCYLSHDERDLHGLLSQAQADGVEAVVGGCSTIAFAQEMGIDAVLIESGAEAINSAIDEALRTVRITRAEQQKSSEIANILNYSFQGIVSASEDLSIVLANDYCCKVLGKAQHELLGRSVTELFAHLDYGAVLGGTKILGELHKVGERLFLVNCVPVEDERETAGLVVTFQDVTSIQEAEGKIRKKIYDKGFVAKYNFADISDRDPSMQETVRIARRFSASNSNLLLFGETGTGKEVFAQSVHNASPRRTGPFVAINCAALSEQLLESELFGYVEGAFTGAVKGGKVGLFEIAHKGTIFLDEIGDISATLQARLLRVLQEREIIRLGHDRVIPIDVRVISATNKDLHQQVAKGVFRQDLLYRLDVLKLTLPPLRQRRLDILPLIKQCIHSQCTHEQCIIQGLDDEANAIVMHHPWPGNIRELRNFCERLCVLCESPLASAADVAIALGRDEPSMPMAVSAVPQSERERIVYALERHDHNRIATAAALGIDKSTLWRKMKKYGLL